ncbi:lens fiber membrane intrinsic protein-like [Saccostrea cucullata]|uniref:lens fiber membrane intrinsic protein-like n=1 Tax=Saccostrea cuccullata TaxID=36930 RepID=UPI002ECFD187
MKFLVFGCLFLFMAIILDVIGLATSYWFSADKNGVKFYGGLWKSCLDIPASQVHECKKYDDVPDWLKAVRGFGLIGVLISAIALISASLKICLKNRISLLIIAIILSFMSALCTVVSISVFARKYPNLVGEGIRKDFNFNFNFSFVFCALSIVLSAFAGISMIFQIAKRSSYRTID